ncbi:MAG: methyltransferase domain-containing protein [Lysobacter sp.]
MPAIAPQRQTESSPTALNWFGSEAGQGLLAAEASAVQRTLAGCPALPWVWMGTTAASPPSVAGRGLLLRRDRRGWDGALRCGLPLPLASETFGAVLLQHVLDDDFDADGLLGECARILAPGGTLWLAALNPWTPYRARWARSGLRTRDPGRWQAALRRAGFAADSISMQWLGPHWRVGHGDAGVGATDRLRAGLALTVSKRVWAAIPPARLRRLHWQAGRSPLDSAR